MDLAVQLKNSRALLGELHLKHRLLARDLQSHRDIDAKNKAELKRLKGIYGNSCLNILFR